MGFNVNNVFTSNYIKASDLQGREHQVTIANVAMEKVGTDQRLVVYFVGHSKGLLLNKTNANNIDFMYGPDTDRWLGKPVTLFQAMVDFQGKTVPAVRVKPAQQAQGPASNVQAPLPAPPPADGYAGPDVPF